MKPNKSKIKKLLKKAYSIAGLSVDDIAKKIKIKITKKFEKNKGCVGKIIEKFFNVSSSNKITMDFPNISVELKTIPINKYGIPQQNTFVCMAPLINNSGILWETSYLFKKLTSVLWIPIENNCNTSLKYRRIGFPLLWKPTKIQYIQLKSDWEALMKMIILGKINYITAEHGEILTLRKKYSNNVYTKAIGIDGKKIMINPFAFYLRKKFTNLILNN